MVSSARKRIIGCALCCALFAQAPVQALAADADTERLGGANRYGTMEKISQAGYDECRWACVATGENFPDALSASPLAGTLDAPLLLTKPDRLSKRCRNELVRLGVEDVFLLGGPDAISERVESEIEDLGCTTHRAWGADRFETSVEILRAMREQGASFDTVVLATGDGFADSLSIGPWTYVHKAPIILVKDTTLPAASSKAIKDCAGVENILIVGGSLAVSDSVRTQLGDDYTYTRVAGADRYRTSWAIAEWECAQDLDWARPALATGERFPDALAGAALQGRRGSCLLLVSDAHTDTLGAVANHSDRIRTLSIFGGPVAVSTKSESVADWLLESGRTKPARTAD